MTKKPCKYCSLKDSVLDSSRHLKQYSSSTREYLSVDIIKNELVVSYDGYDRAFQDSVKISYCPICGRSLEK